MFLFLETWLVSCVVSLFLETWLVSCVVSLLKWLASSTLLASQIMEKLSEFIFKYRIVIILRQIFWLKSKFSIFFTTKKHKPIFKNSFFKPNTWIKNVLIILEIVFKFITGESSILVYEASCGFWIWFLRHFFLQPGVSVSGQYKPVKSSWWDCTLFMVGFFHQMWMLG